MSYRPYPDRERALRRARRGGRPSSGAGASVLPYACRVPRVEVLEAFPVGQRVMSSRRLDGGSA